MVANPTKCTARSCRRPKVIPSGEGPALPLESGLLRPSSTPGDRRRQGWKEFLRIRGGCGASYEAGEIHQAERGAPPFPEAFQRPIKESVMKFRLQLAVLCLLASCPLAMAQKAAPPPTGGECEPRQRPRSLHPPAPQRPVARVNGAVLTDHDLLREMYTIFPYAKQHNGGFPKAMEADIRRGALKMIEFEELVYQEATRRHMTIAPERLAASEKQFRQRFRDRPTVSVLSPDGGRRFRASSAHQDQAVPADRGSS